jgi:hypothetical protein
MTQWEKMEKMEEKKTVKEVKKLSESGAHLYCNIPVHTRKPAVWVYSVLWCAKINYCTRTHSTRFGNTVGFPVPVLNPICGWGCNT